MTAIHFPNLKQTEARLRFILKIITKWMAVIRSGWLVAALDLPERMVFQTFQYDNQQH